MVLWASNPLQTKIKNPTWNPSSMYILLYNYLCSRQEIGTAHSLGYMYRYRYLRYLVYLPTNVLLLCTCTMYIVSCASIVLCDGVLLLVSRRSLWHCTVSVPNANAYIVCCFTFRSSLSFPTMVYKSNLLEQLYLCTCTKQSLGATGAHIFCVLENLHEHVEICMFNCPCKHIWDIVFLSLDERY